MYNFIIEPDAMDFQYLDCSYWPILTPLKPLCLRLMEDLLVPLLIFRPECSEAAKAPRGSKLRAIFGAGPEKALRKRPLKMGWG